MMTPFEWVVGDSSKDHTVTALPPTAAQPPRYTTLRGTTLKKGSPAGRSPPAGQRMSTAGSSSEASVDCQRGGSLSGSVVVSSCRVLRYRGRLYDRVSYTILPWVSTFSTDVA